MRTALAAMLIFFSATAHADQAEDFVSCVIGRAAVALINGAVKDEALEAGYDLCPLPNDTNDEIDLDTLGSTINEMVEKMASE